METPALAATPTASPKEDGPLVSYPLVKLHLFAGAISLLVSRAQPGAPNGVKENGSGVPPIVELEAPTSMVTGAVAGSSVRSMTKVSPIHGRLPGAATTNG